MRLCIGRAGRGDTCASALCGDLMRRALAKLLEPRDDPRLVGAEARARGEIHDRAAVDVRRTKVREKVGHVDAV